VVPTNISDANPQLAEEQKPSINQIGKVCTMHLVLSVVHSTATTKELEKLKRSIDSMGYVVHYRSSIDDVQAIIIEGSDSWLEIHKQLSKEI
jgi:hypothetical protein